MGGSIPPLLFIPYSFIACVGEKKLLVFTLSNHTHVCIYVGGKKYFVGAFIWGL